jgi:hypothetical protein
MPCAMDDAVIDKALNATERAVAEVRSRLNHAC